MRKNIVVCFSLNRRIAHMKNCFVLPVYIKVTAGHVLHKKIRINVVGDSTQLLFAQHQCLLGGTLLGDVAHGADQGGYLAVLDADRFAVPEHPAHLPVAAQQ